MESEKLDKHRRVLDAIAWCRDTVLAEFEVQLGESPNWKFVRSRLLKAFGERAGLLGEVNLVLDPPSTKLPKHSNEEMGAK